MPSDLQSLGPLLPALPHSVLPHFSNLSRPNKALRKVFPQLAERTGEEDQREAPDAQGGGVKVQAGCVTVAKSQPSPSFRFSFPCNQSRFHLRERPWWPGPGFRTPAGIPRSVLSP